MRVVLLVFGQTKLYFIYITFSSTLVRPLMGLLCILCTFGTFNVHLCATFPLEYFCNFSSQLLENYVFTFNFNQLPFQEQTPNFVPIGESGRSEKAARS